VADATALARDAAAVAFAGAWQSWTADEGTVVVLGEIDWAATAAAPLLTDVDALTGEDETDIALDDLDHTASVAAEPARRRHARALADLAAAGDRDTGLREALEREQLELREERDPLPSAPPWVRSTPLGGVPLWRTVDFTSGLGGAQRAGLEAALLASGLLTATLTVDGTLTAADGELLVGPSGPPAGTALTRVLAVDSASPVPAEQVRAVLDRVALGDAGHPTWVDTDGSWGNGPLRGRHTVAAARHIGAEARAASRAARLAEIDGELAVLHRVAAAREKARAAVVAQQEALEAHLRSAPRSGALATARALAANESVRAGRLATAARDKRDQAQRLRREWVRARDEHRAACREFDLPATSDELDKVIRALHDAVAGSDRAVRQLRNFIDRVAAHQRALETVVPARDEREQAEQAADSDWATWHEEASAFAALKDNVGADAAKVRGELHGAEKQLQECRVELRAARRLESGLGEKVGAAGVEVRTHREKATAAQQELVRAVGMLARRVTLPGVATAATNGGSLGVDVPRVDPASAEAAVRAVSSALDRRGQAVDATGLMRAQQTLERELNAYDVIASVAEDVHLVEIADATGRRPVADAAAELDRRREQGRAALSDREHRVFTEFVLGGVAEELRRRLGQARTLVDAMNASLATIRTSHGIGVKLRWILAEEPGSPVARIRTLVTTAGDVRPIEQTAELSTLLKDRVNAAFETDKTAGYATHLKAALDYRAWHEVEVIITGPEKNQERRIARRAKLSEGETRFVSYVTLFAAVDAYLSGLPDATRALRLILLDDAFAKVDDPTMAELMGLLVRLDVDFAMTGHALWGCYPQVPALDCYEVRRREGTAAVTTHVHWDGHTRHLRAAR
jgi:hypothetical protein